MGKSKAYCVEGKHYPEYVLANSTGEIDVLCESDGTPTNRYADGTVGVSDIDRQEAETDDSVMCPEHYAECNWHHGAPEWTKDNETGE
jgi:hypothetical protein